MKRITAFIFIILTFTACSFQEPAVRSFFAMDTFCDINLYGSQEDIDNINVLINDLDKKFSAYDSESQIYELNKNGKISSADSDIISVISQSTALSEKYGDSVDISSGALTELWGVSTGSPYLPSKIEIGRAISTINYRNISVKNNQVFLPKGMKLDLGSVAKGYACDKLYEYLNKTDVRCAVFSMGSSSLLYGAKPNGKPFRVDIRMPEGEGILGTVSAGETFVSTSGGYERYFELEGKKYIHIFDLSTGFPSESDLTSVTVFCDSGIMSDFLSTLIFLDGTENLPKHLSAEDYKVIAVSSDKEIYISDGINFTLDNDSGYVISETDYE